MTPCPLCGQPCRELFGDLRDRFLSAAGVWTLVACGDSACGLVHIQPMPTPEQNVDAYRDYYFHDAAANARSPDRAPKAGWLRRKFRRLRRRFTDTPLKRSHYLMYLDATSPGTVLEIGCGDGTRAKALAECGWTVEALELDERSAQLARSRGITVHIGGLEGADLGTERYDAIVMNHVIEHLMFPIDGMRKIHRALKPGGRFVCTTPNTGSWGARRFGRDWIGLDAPRHLHLFSEASLRRLLSLDFGSVEVFSSTVNSGILLYASQRMGEAVPYRPGEEQGDPLALDRVHTMGLVARWRALFPGGAGEELVGIARK